MVILVATEAAVAILMVITTRSEGRGIESRTISACHGYLYQLDGHGTAVEDYRGRVQGLFVGCVGANQLIAVP